ncbi:MAG: thermonuclease family protein [Nostoc sp. DedVER02]|uniref:thermonuclease family protein n=1 Tax=unclassified Nostoc TaxID=2593658 RepID=UPI002AD20462|nr:MULTISPECIES: thermonuclease family protein [unclassified Nostoc]MDZ7984407.1 thermonuclease family protein [Nostoc sp. DedVER02]MDZ8115046.1 thermonuclease family protein [Nostoc sp. DedVER01b]
MEKLTKPMQFWLCATIIILGLIGCDRVNTSGEPVERVSDGDTIVVKDSSGKNFTVRFACVDAPEIAHTNKEKQSKRTSDRNQFTWGVKAQERVQQLVQKGGDRVTLNITDSDRYGRKIAEVRLQNGTFVQQVLLKEGLAKVYRPYLNKCPSKDLVQQAEAEAKQQRLGIWSDAKFVNPWEYRTLSKK